MPKLALRRATLCAAAAALLAVPATAPAATPAEHVRALARLTERHGGDRVADSSGYAAAARYVERTLRAAGYRVRRQAVRFPVFDVRSPSRLQVEGLRLRRGSDVRTVAFSGAGDVRGPLRTLGAAGTKRATGCRPRHFDGFERGAVALVWLGACAIDDQAANAARAGAAAVLVANVLTAMPDALRAAMQAPAAIPTLTVSVKAGRRLARRAGAEARVTVDAVIERRSADNLIAQRPGTRGRVLMAGAHLDTVPRSPGANDNASGVAALLAIAQRRREPGVRFGFWAAEELGMYGSERYVASLSRAERRRIIGYLNLDMVASPNPLAAVYGRGWVRAGLMRAVRAAGLEPTFIQPGKRSDHAPFARAGIPVGGLHTGTTIDGPDGKPADPCYHLPCDTLDGADLRMLDVMTDVAERFLRRR